MDHYETGDVAKKYHATFNEGSDDPILIRKSIDRYSKFVNNIKEAGHILDAGCGTGRFVKYFRAKNFRVTGIDASTSMLEIAIKDNPDTEFFVMDMRALTFPSSYFDGIWNSGCILHLDEEGAMSTFKESARVLKKDGIFYVATRTRVEDSVIVEESTEGGKIVVNYHSVAKLRLLLELAGFEIIGISVEPDDFGRPFDYCYIFARNLNEQKLGENKYFQLNSGNEVDIFVCSDGAARIFSKSPISKIVILPQFKSSEIYFGGRV